MTYTPKSDKLFKGINEAII